MRASFDLDDRRGSPFPSDRFTVADVTQNTGRRVTLPKPDCAVQPNDCADFDVINTLDGFNVQPRLSIPFDGPIDKHHRAVPRVTPLAPGDPAV